MSYIKIIVRFGCLSDLAQPQSGLTGYGPRARISPKDPDDRRRPSPSRSVKKFSLRDDATKTSYIEPFSVVGPRRFIACSRSTDFRQASESIVRVEHSKFMYRASDGHHDSSLAGLVDVHHWHPAAFSLPTVTWCSRAMLNPRPKDVDFYICE